MAAGHGAAGHGAPAQLPRPGESLQPLTRPALSSLPPPPSPVGVSQVLDVGCGIGGPLRAVARFSGASVTGVNNNAYQISRGVVLNAKAGLAATCSFLKADFMAMPEPDCSYDAAYQLEATCHAPDLVGCYKEIYRLLKPGARFASCDWVMTEAFNAADAAHVQCKEDICLGNGLPDLRRSADAVDALCAAGFVVEEAYDLAEGSQIPWYDPIDKDRPLSASGFRTTRVGRTLTHYMVSALETLRMAPPGSTSVSSFLVKGADALVAGGKKAIFTPMFFTLARKPN